MATAIERAEAMFGALGSAERQADLAMREELGRYDPLWRDRRGMWLLYLWTRRHQRDQAPATLRLFRRARTIHRRTQIAETRGVDTSVPGWRGGGSMKSINGGK